MFFNAFNSFTKALRLDEVYIYFSLIKQIKYLIKSAISGKSAREIGLLYFEIDIYFSLILLIEQIKY